MKNKIQLILLLILLSTKLVNAQEENNKKIQMGISLGSSLNFNKVDTKLIEELNPAYDLSIGMNIIKNFNENLGFNTGVEFDFSSMKYKFNNIVYYHYSDNEILNKNDKNDNEAYKIFVIEERQEKPIYLTIPTMLLFKTDYIGYNRYFAKFGMRHSFCLKNTTNDKGELDNTDIEMSQNNSVQKTFERMKLQQDLSIYTGTVGVSAGTEWNYSGSSSIQFELGYYYGINNLHRGDALIGDKQKNMTLFESTEVKTSNIQYTTVKSSRNQLALKITFLF